MAHGLSFGSNGPLVSDSTLPSSLRLHLIGCFLERRLGCGEPGHWNAERRATHIVQTDPVAELDAVRVSTMFAADAELDIGTRAASLLDGDLHELADAILINGRKRIFLEDLQFLVGREERA